MVVRTWRQFKMSVIFDNQLYLEIIKTDKLIDVLNLWLLCEAVYLFRRNVK